MLIENTTELSYVKLDVRLSEYFTEAQWV